MSRIHSEYLDADRFDCSVAANFLLRQEPDEEENEEEDDQEEREDDKEGNEGYSE